MIKNELKKWRENLNWGISELLDAAPDALIHNTRWPEPVHQGRFWPAGHIFDTPDPNTQATWDWALSCIRRHPVPCIALRISVDSSQGTVGYDAEVCATFQGYASPDYHCLGLGNMFKVSYLPPSDHIFSHIFRLIHNHLCFLNGQIDIPEV